MPRVIGLMKKGTGALRMSGWVSLVSLVFAGSDLRWKKLTVHEHSNREQAHETAFSIVHVEAISQPLLRLAANFALEALTVACRNQIRCKVVGKVLADCSTLGQDERLRE
jgi:hypothetical protein